MSSFFLIADDSQAKLMMLQMLVRHSKKFPDILVAHSTDEAKKLIDDHDIAAAFIDYEMPTENGPAVISHLKKKHPHAHVALVTSFDSGGYEEAARAAGAEAFVCTTDEEKEVKDKLENLLLEWAA